MVAGALYSTDKTAVGCTELKYCFPSAVGGFADDAFTDDTMLLVKVV